MPERSSIAQVAQIGPEVTPGTAVAATKRLGSLRLTPSVNAEVEPFTPSGLKFPALQTLNREWTDVALEGQPTYEEVIYPLAMCVGAPTVSELLDGATPTGVYEWVFAPSSSAADAPKTFTLEYGQAGVQAEKAAHLLLNSLGLSISRSEVTMDGSGFAKALQTAITMTAGLETPVDLTPITPGQFSMYMADTAAGLSAAGASDPSKRVLRLVSANAAIEDRYNPAWFVNHTEQSFTTWVENPDGVGGQSSMTVEADANGMALLATMRAGTTKFIRLEALGPVLYNAGTMLNTQALFRWDMAVKVAQPDSLSDEDGVYAIGLNLQPVHDGTWGKAMQVTVRNQVEALT